MQKKKSPKDFFKQARDKGSESNKDIVNGEEIKKRLQPSTAPSTALTVASTAPSTPPSINSTQMTD
jgi:hypothetical protein